MELRPHALRVRITTSNSTVTGKCTARCVAGGNHPPWWDQDGDATIPAAQGGQEHARPPPPPSRPAARGRPAPPSAGRADRSSGAHPPSGPTSSTGWSRLGATPVRSANAAPGRAASVARSATSSMTGRVGPVALHRRRARHRRSRTIALAAFASSHRTTDRSARNGTIRSMPSSVSFCTMSSGLSPFTSAKPTVSAGAGRGGLDDGTGHLELGPERRRRQRPAPSATMSGFARPHAQHPREVVAVVVGQRRARRGRRRRRAGRARRPGARRRYRNAERMRERKPGIGRGHVIAALRRELAEQLLLLGGEVVGHLHARSHDQVAPAAALEVRHAAAPQAELPSRRACRAG